MARTHGLQRRARVTVTAVALAVLMATVATIATIAPAFGISDEGDDLLLPLGNDRLWAGYSLELGDATIDNDLLAAGRTLNIEDCRLGGSIRAAGQTVRVSDTMADESITLAGETVSVADTKATAVSLAGRVASFSGTCEEISMFASEATIDGTVTGDATIEADNVVVDKNAVIRGTLHVSSATEPTIEKGARVTSIDYSAPDNDAAPEDDESQPIRVEVVTSGIVGHSIAGSIIGLLGTLVVAVLAQWLFARHSIAAAEMVRTRTAAHIASGIIGSLATPVALIVLCIMVITLPVAGCLLLTLIALALVSCGFAGASLARLAFPKLGRYRAALAGGAIVGTATLVPFLGTLVRIAAFVYLFGYVLQTIYLGLRTTSVPVDDSVPRDAGTPSLPGM